MPRSRPTVLVTLGRLPPAIDVARALDAAGWRVIVADPYFLNMARTSRRVHRVHRVPSPARAPRAYLDALRQLVHRYDVRRIVPVSEETPHVAALVHADGPPVYTMPQATVLALHSKADFAERAHAAGLAVPPTCRANDARAATITQGDYVLKPEFGCSGRGVSMHTAGAPLPDRAATTVVQARVHGEELSAFALTHDGRVIAHVTYRARIRHGGVAVCFERIEHEVIAAEVARLVAAEGYTGFIAFDFIAPNDGPPLAIECNPRATSGLHFVRPVALAAVLTGSALPDGPVLRDETLLQEFWSNWTHWFSALGQRSERRRTGAALRAARDVTWAKSDPGVFLLAPVSTWPIISRAIAARTSFAAVLAQDIEWRPTQP